MKISIITVTTRVIIAFCRMKDTIRVSAILQCWTSCLTTRRSLRVDLASPSDKSHCNHKHLQWRKTQGTEKTCRLLPAAMQLNWKQALTLFSPITKCTPNMHSAYLKARLFHTPRYSAWQSGLIARVFLNSNNGKKLSMIANLFSKVDFQRDSEGWPRFDCDCLFRKGNATARSTRRFNFNWIECKII